MNALHKYIVSTDEATARRRLLLDREGAALAVQEHRTEALTCIRRYRSSKKRLRELNEKLRELA